MDSKKPVFVLSLLLIFLSLFAVNAASSTYGSDAYGSSEYGGGLNPADLDGDGDVDIDDLIIVTRDFGRTSGYDQRADIIIDGEIDIYDIVFVASRFT